MSKLQIQTIVATLLLVIATTSPVYCFAQPGIGSKAPSFSLADLDGKKHQLSDYKEKITIIYFFDAESRSCQKGLGSIDQLVRKFPDGGLLTVGISSSPVAKIKKFRSQLKPSFPVLVDPGKVSDLYAARMILPTVYILDSGLKVLDVIQGGGKSTEVMLTRLAERELLRKKTMVAKAIGGQLIKKEPAKAKMIQAYAALQEGDTRKAEEVFSDLKREPGEGKILGEEGLVAVYAKKGQTGKALELAEQVEKKAPGRGFVNTVKGNIYFSKNMPEKAEAEYKKSTAKKDSEMFQRASGYNQLGRFYAEKGEYKKSRELYDRSIELDPGYIDATSNKGYTYEKEGRLDSALAQYRMALQSNPNDVFSSALAQNAQAMLSMQKDAGERRRIDQLVKNLSERFKSQKKIRKGDEDTWTSRPMILTFLNIEEKGGLSERDGFSTVLTSQLANMLNASGRVQVVERILIERLLEELNLGSSELADPETALHLGRVLAAKLIGTGSLYFMPNTTLLNLRMLDTETTVIAKVVTTQFGSDISLEKELNTLNRDLLSSIIEKYPLQGYIVQVSGQEVFINLGQKQGITLGSKFEVLEEQKPVEYRGKMLRGSTKPVGEIGITRVEADLAYGRIIRQDRPLRRDDKIKEKIMAKTL
jgi:tetratricopeptide (TPR) repeat protein/peroxiredoxin